MNEARRALLSVYDKTGIVDLARELTDLGWELLSSGGTASVIAEAGIDVVDVADHTGVPPLLGHRVVTLHPRIHAGILADRDDASHRADLDAHGVDPIDLVVVNLYPFGDEPGIEMIDIGGPALVRAAAKNHAHVGVVVDPVEYPRVLEEIRADEWLDPASRRRLARTAFAHTAAYDAAIVTWMDDTGDLDTLPPSVHLALELADPLRYGENPHQRGARYRPIGSPSWWDDVEQLSGVEPSYLNLLDADASWRLIQDLGPDPAVVIVKHANPCGAAVGTDLETAYGRALECDPVSAFGGVVACNRPIDPETATLIEGAAQADVVLAPGFGPGVVDRLADKRKATRVLRVPAGADDPSLQVRPLGHDVLVQDQPRLDTGPGDWNVVTLRQPTEEELADAHFAWVVCAYVRSNAVVLAKDRVAWGIGAGQPNRVASADIAASRAGGRAAGGACASDAFFPFPDGVHAAADAGASVVVQPGGSVNDYAVIAAADDRGLAMVLTGERQFRH